MKLSLIFSTCFLAVVVFGDLDSSKNPSPNPNPAENSKTLQDIIRELEKSQKEFKDLKASFEKSQEDIKSLKEKVEKLEQDISQDEGLWLLRPPVRGPPGRKGESGIKGEMGNSGLADPQSIRSCSEAMKILPFASQRISLYPNFCDFETDGGGWTTIQKRSSGPRNEFNRNWNDYVKGFGSLDKNFWIGLDNIHALTKNGDQELRIELEDFEGNKGYAKYTSFSVSSASDFYRLSISGYSGDAGNDMNHPSDSPGMHNGMRFSTPDKDNDKDSSGNCAASWSSGWWHNACFRSNLNGLYREKGETFPGAEGIIWESWKGLYYSLAKTEMKIRTRK